MKVYIWVLMVLASGVLSGCGKRGALRAPEDTMYPRSYPAPTENAVAQ